MGFKPRSSALELQCSANRAAKTHALGACQIVEYILTRERNEKWNEDLLLNLYFCVNSTSSLVQNNSSCGDFFYDIIFTQTSM